MSRRIAIAAMMAGLAGPLAAQSGAPVRPGFAIPPKAGAVEGAIGEVLLDGLFAEPFVCGEHPDGQLAYAGDALGTDCMITGGVTDAGGFMRAFQTDGRTNADWYGWHADVHAPIDATVIGVLAKDGDNVPGTMARPPAAMVQLRSADGVIVVLAHVTTIAVKPGDHVTAGQVIAKVGNAGMARNPHIHVGAYREADAVPLQIRWNLRSLAKLQAGPG